MGFWDSKRYYPPGASYVERSNLSMRMGLRRFTRPTNAHSKKLENHHAALAAPSPSFAL